jgi:CheY-like chemotaxis protein
MENKPLVLVADDNPDICDLLQVALGRLGVRVTVVYNGRDAYEKIVAERPALALLDLMMPEMTGLEVLAALRSDDRFKDLPVIMITARTQDDDVERGFALGATDYVTKPFNVKDLSGKVASIVGLGTE